jgi:3-hydroxyisobutyrate dehydrogenase
MSLQVGFIGIGNMGWPMSLNILKAGHHLTVYDRDPDRAVRFARENKCRAAERLADLVRAEFVITMLPDSAEVRDALTVAEGGGLAKVLKPGTVVIDMSSSDPVETRKLGPEIAATGAVLIDAPVSGAVPRARTGTLAIMIGGDDRAAIERAKPLLLAMGNRLFDTGSLGTGHAMKALNNYIAGTGFAACCEALLIGKRFGLDPTTMVDILNVSSGKNFSTELVMKEQIIDGKFSSGFALGLLAKDVRIASDLGEAMKVDAPLTRLVKQRWADAREELGATRDNTEAFKAWDKSLP